MNFDEMIKTGETAEAPRRGVEVRRRQPVVIVGGLPTVSLLPREFHTAARARMVRYVFVGVVVLALVVAGGATALAATLASAAQQQLAAANVESQSLLAQLGKFSDVQKLQHDVQLGQAAVTVGSSPEVDWQAQLDAIEQNMPAGYTVTQVTADSADAFEAYPQGTTPLDKPRAATVVLTVTAPTITQLPVWLRELRSIPAYADATASVANADTAGYTAQLTIHLSPKALVDAQKGSAQ